MATPRICSIPDCGKSGKLRRGWCEAHHSRWRRHGDPFAGGPLSPRHQAQRFFRETVLTYEGNECLAWPFWCDENGRGKVRWDGWDQIVSRLVCEMVKGPPPTPEHQAAHSCGRGHLGCVTKGHVSWKTPVENNADKIAHGTHTRGEDHSVAKLTEAQVIEIRALRGAKSQRLIAEQFGVTQSQVCQIHTRKSWAWL